MTERTTTTLASNPHGFKVYPRVRVTKKDEPKPVAYATSGMGEVSGLSIEYVVLEPGEQVRDDDRPHVCSTVSMGGGRRLAIVSRGLSESGRRKVREANEVLMLAGEAPWAAGEFERVSMGKFAVTC